jgi:hypothetical protein
MQACKAAALIIYSFCIYLCTVNDMLPLSFSLVHFGLILLAEVKNVEVIVFNLYIMLLITGYAS